MIFSFRIARVWVFVSCNGCCLFSFPAPCDTASHSYSPRREAAVNTQSCSPATPAGASGRLRQSTECFRRSSRSPMATCLPYLLIASTGPETTRKPSALPRVSGSFPSRSADRQLHGLRFQLPPRITRCEPAVGPVGSSVGDLP